MDEPETPGAGVRNRRSFLNWLLGTSFGALFGSVLYPVARFLSPPNIPEASTRQVEAGAVNDPELLEKGFKILRFGNEPVILVRTSEDDYRAFAGTCTHLDCIVEFHKEPGRIWCNCHNGEYDLRGRVVAGPPPKPLETFEVDLVSKSAGQPKTIVVSRA
jgi:cytochrome b6-f complex iron-sulfur subunit